MPGKQEREKVESCGFIWRIDVGPEGNRIWHTSARTARRMNIPVADAGKNSPIAICSSAKGWLEDRFECEKTKMWSDACKI